MRRLAHSRLRALRLAWTLLTFHGRAGNDSRHTFRVGVEHQECERRSARVSPLMYKTERFVDERAGRLGLRLTLDRVGTRSGDDVIKRCARPMVRRIGWHLCR